MSIPTAEETERLGALLEVLRVHGVTRFQGDSLTLELSPPIVPPPEPTLAEEERARLARLGADPLFDAVDGPPESVIAEVGLSQSGRN